MLSLTVVRGKGREDGLGVEGHFKDSRWLERFWDRIFDGFEDINVIILYKREYT